MCDHEAAVVAQLILSLPHVFVEKGTPRDADRLIVSLRTVIADRSLRRNHRLHLLRVSQLMCRLQGGTITIANLEEAVRCIAMDLPANVDTVSLLRFFAKQRADAPVAALLLHYLVASRPLTCLRLC